MCSSVGLHVRVALDPSNRCWRVIGDDIYGRSYNDGGGDCDSSRDNKSQRAVRTKDDNRLRTIILPAAVRQHFEIFMVTVAAAATHSARREMETTIPSMESGTLAEGLAAAIDAFANSTKVET